MRPILEAAARYIRRHPEELLRAVRAAMALRLGVPLEVLRWLAAQTQSKKAPRDVELSAVPPGLRVAATLQLMGNEVRASGILYVDRVNLSAEELRFEVRLAEVSLKILKEAPDSPLATLLKSGALDLSKPGNLVAYMPKRPAMLVEAGDDRIVLDLKKLPKLAGKGQVDKALALIMPVLSVRGIQTDEGHLDVLLHAFPEGVGEAVGAVRRVL